MKAISVLLLVLLVGVVPADDTPPPAPKLPLGKETTYVTGPLDKHGYIDYEAALNAEMSKGISPEKNANALLALVVGPAPEGGDGIPLDYYKWLDIPVPPKQGDYFVGVYAYVHDKLGISGERLEAVFEAQSRVSQRPWVPKDCPPLAEWLTANQKPLALATEALKRPEYFNPLVSRRKEGDSSNLIGALLPSVQRYRELAFAFSARAMLRLQDKKFDEAWEDILTCHRLGRLVTRGATLIEALVGIAITQIASTATVTYLERADLTSKQALKCQKDLRELPHSAPLADKIGVCERMMGLDALQLIRRGMGGMSGLAGLVGNEAPVIADEKKALEMMDWTTVMQTMNKWYDRLGAAMKMKDRAARAKEFEKIEEEYKATKKVMEDAEKMKKLLNEKDAGKVVGKALGDVLMGLLSPAVQKVQSAHDRSEQVTANLQIAFALAAYNKDHGRYPAKLADLAPKYIASIPDDVFVGKPLTYKPSEKGYLFYSVGVNGKDDGGNSYDDDPRGDDLRVKMPQPALKK
ncbi:hypothetical protein J8F10_26600 [Gemmata sp. G18]|uniref:Type II secretion system protein GspG C-terminal domain-containing protein n=1 Tax=Gemmata palustris TaxID=2822762 RepID=A0ABS5BYM3_9BACT|nr:hypothetical protein [Gemmata palustris]MBP3958832.1 hypothetical protein [Gemmata palustris]